MDEKELKGGLACEAFSTQTDERRAYRRCLFEPRRAVRPSAEQLFHHIDNFDKI